MIVRADRDRPSVFAPRKLKCGQRLILVLLHLGDDDPGRERTDADAAADVKVRARPLLCTAFVRPRCQNFLHNLTSRMETKEREAGIKRKDTA